MEQQEKTKALQRYDDLADRHEAAYISFERIYTRQHPQPQKPKSQGVDRVVTSALVFLVIASVIVSGSRTVIEFGGGLVGGSAFVMLELGIIGYAYISAKRDERNHDRSVRRLTKAGITMAFIVALSANIHATLKAGGIVINPVIDTLILLFVAISAPTLAYIAGELLGIETVSGERRHESVNAAYDKLMNEWREGLNRAFASKRGDLGVRVEVHSEAFPMESAGIPLPALLPTRSTLGHSKQPQAAKIAYAYFKDNPAAVMDEELNLVTLADELEIGKSTLYKVRGELRKAQMVSSEEKA